MSEQRDAMHVARIARHIGQAGENLEHCLAGSSSVVGTIDTLKALDRLAVLLLANLWPMLPRPHVEEGDE